MFRVRRLQSFVLVAICQYCIIRKRATTVTTTIVVYSITDVIVCYTFRRRQRDDAHNPGPDDVVKHHATLWLVGRRRQTGTFGVCRGAQHGFLIHK